MTASNPEKQTQETNRVLHSAGQRRLNHFQSMDWNEQQIRWIENNTGRPVAATAANLSQGFQWNQKPCFATMNQHNVLWPENNFVWH